MKENRQKKSYRSSNMYRKSAGGLMGDTERENILHVW
jgi:hypothetical protein